MVDDNKYRNYSKMAVTVLLNELCIEQLLKTILYKNNLVIYIITASIIFIGLMVYVTFINNLFGLTSISFSNLAICLIISFVTIMWIEPFKLIFKKK